jgi:hypothetical protein
VKVIAVDANLKKGFFRLSGAAVTTITKTFSREGKYNGRVIHPAIFCAVSFSQGL